MAVFLSGALALGQLAMPVAFASSGPSVSITAPSSGSTVSGTVTVAATGSTDASQSDYPTEIDYYLDGQDKDQEYCYYSASTCNTNWSWDTTGLSGQHTLTARVTTEDGLTATSSPVTVTTTSPGPSVSITAPSSGSTVSGTVTVAATGSTDASQSDYPTEIDYYLDGQDKDQEYCYYSASTCNTNWSWDTTGLSGQHTLTARVTTEDGLTATSSPVTLAVYSSTQITWHATRPHSGARRVAEVGRLTARRDKAVAGQRVTVTLSRAGRTVASTALTTRSDGSFAVRFPLVESSKLTATFAGTHIYGASEATLLQGAFAVTHCRQHKHKALVGKAINGRCSVPHLPAGVHILYQEKTPSGWQTFGRDRTIRPGGFRFTYYVNGPGRFTLRFSIAKNSLFLATNTHPLHVRITQPKPVHPRQRHSSPPPAPSQPCTTTSSGSCIQGGEFCPAADYGQAGYDASGREYICEGDPSHPHWETP